MVSRIKHYKLNVKIYMFWIRRHNPLSKEIADFGRSRARYSTSKDHVEILHKFVKNTKIQSYEDITEGDIAAYIQSIRLTTASEYRRSQTVQALFLFIQYKKNEEIRMMKRMKRGRPEKIERNKEFVSLYSQKYTYDEIADKYKLNKRTVYDIIKRYNNMS